MTEGLLSLVDLRALARPVALGDLPSPAESDLAEVAARARAIIDQVRRGGDEALLRLTGELDGVVPERLVLGPEDFEEAYGRLEEGLRAALTKAHARIVALHQAELPVATKVQSDGITVVRRHLPVASAGCYVPGGTARYPSSVLHTAAIARVAGVPRVVVATPPTSSGGIDRATLAACFVAGVDAAYPVGGAQAIAALAYGTETIEPVEVIVGPGNRYVAAAKAAVAHRVGVGSSYAGPSEVVVIADASVPPAIAAVDVAVQAEHGPHGLAWLVTWDEGYLEQVQQALAGYVVSSPRADALRATLAEQGFVVLVRDAAQALEVANLVAPEHLELLYRGAEGDAALARTAGAVFVGACASAAFGDYVAGPSHVLPTARTARFASVLGVEDFLRRQHTIEVKRDALASLGWAVEELASAEGLVAHRDSIALRRAEDA